MTNERKAHECPKDLGLLVESTPQVVFDSLPIERVSKKRIVEELTQHSEVTAEELNMYAGIVQGMHDEEVKTVSTLFDYGNNRDQIVSELGRQVAGCNRCYLEYQHTLRKLVKRELYNTVEQADDATLGLLF